MAEPATTAKVTIAAVLAGLGVGAAAELVVDIAGNLFGAGAGAYINRSLMEPAELQRIGPGRTFVMALLFGLIAPAAVEWGAGLAGVHFGEQRAALVPAVSMLCAAFWQRILKGLPDKLGMLPGLGKRPQGSGEGDAP